MTKVHAASQHRIKSTQKCIPVHKVPREQERDDRSERSYQRAFYHRKGPDLRGREGGSMETRRQVERRVRRRRKLVQITTKRPGARRALGLERTPRSSILASLIAKFVVLCSPQQQAQESASLTHPILYHNPSLATYYIHIRPRNVQK